jgi:membrane protein DedA with SNARE-associated domain
MPFFASLLPNFLFLLTSYKYLLLFMGVVIEGPILMVATGFLVHLKFFDLIPAFFIILAGDLLGDVIWYYTGYFFAEPFLRKYGKFFKITPEIFEKAKSLFHENHTRILLISKITIGVGMALAVLMAAGASHVPFRKYMFLNFIGETILVTVLLTIGYFFGQMYVSISGIMKIYFIVGTVIAIGVFIYLFTKYIRRVVIAAI